MKEMPSVEGAEAIAVKVKFTTLSTLFFHQVLNGKEANFI